MLKNETLDKLYFSSFFAAVFLGLFHYFAQGSNILGLYLFTIAAIPLLLLPLFILKTLGVNKDSRFAVTLKISALTIFYANAMGTLFLYKYYEYDQFAHIATLASLTVIFASFLKQTAGNPLPVVASAVFLAMFLGGVSFELVQFSLDQVFDSKLFNDPDQTVSLDVFTDIIADGIGIIAGLIIFKKLK